VEESLTCCDIFDAGGGFNARGDAEMEAESDGNLDLGHYYVARY